MADLVLRRDEAESGELPRLCARCGGEAETDFRKAFTWHPSWMILLVVLSVPIGVLIVLLFQKRMIVTLPLCGRHRAALARRKWLLAAGVLAGVGAIAAGVLMLNRDANAGAGPGPWTAVAVAGVLTLLATLVLAFVFQQAFVRAVAMSDTDITLTGLDAEFTRAVVLARRESRKQVGTDDAADDYEERMRKRRVASQRRRDAGSS